MSFHRRIRTIYRKELIDILRDRRTLIAMILVPIILYPLLLLGSVQAVSHQAQSLQQETVLIGVTSQTQKSIIEELIALDRQALSENVNSTQSQDNERGAFRDLVERNARGPFGQQDESQGEPIVEYSIHVLESRENIDQAIRQRMIHLGVVFEKDAFVDDPARRNHVSFSADLEEARSRFVHNRFLDMLKRTQERIKAQRLASLSLPQHLVDPFEVETSDLSAPPSILGQILPLILVLMTITGAIYPAIDLTAGERERGTLESLMVCPVPVLDLIVGKFLVVTTVAIMGATLNLASVSATVYFGGFNQVISQTGGSVPIVQMLTILLCLVPFAVLMSAIMIAVCAYARTFKEAQNYVTPVIIAVLLPGGIAAMPATRLDGVMLVMPVGNMVLLARELLIGANVTAWQLGLVLFSTSLYAAAAVGVAAQVFGAEAVVFSDAGSLKTLFSRRLIRPRATPPASMSLAVVALLFPVWFFIQSSISPKPGGDPRELLRATAILMPLFFAVAPFIVLKYWRTDVVQSLSFRRPPLQYVVAAVLLGITAWIPAHQISVWQEHFLTIPREMMEQLVEFEKAIGDLPPWSALLVLAVIPAFCEEIMFRGMLMSGLRPAAGKWTTILASAAIFGVFHFLLIKLLPTFGLGIVLALLCWQSRSIFPGLIMHLLHNGLLVAETQFGWREQLGMSGAGIPTHLMIPGLALFVIGLLLTLRTAGSALDGNKRQGFSPPGGSLHDFPDVKNCRPRPFENENARVGTLPSKT